MGSPSVRLAKGGPLYPPACAEKRAGKPFRPGTGPSGRYPGRYPADSIVWEFLAKYLFLLAGVEGLEPPTPGFGDRCSSQLSYTPSRADRCMKARPNARATIRAAHSSRHHSGVGAATTAVP